MEGEIGGCSNRLVEQERPEPAVDGQTVIHDGACAGRLARYCDQERVAAKLADVALDPCKSKRLVQQTGIHNSLLPDLGRREEAKGTKLRKESCVLVADTWTVLILSDECNNLHDTG